MSLAEVIQAKRERLQQGARWYSGIDFWRSGADDHFYELQEEFHYVDPAGLHEHFAAIAKDALADGQKCDGSVLDGGVLCISLSSCGERRQHTTDELIAWGFSSPVFVDAFGPDDVEVLEWFNSHKVMKYPPCFRCGGIADCQCPNNTLLLEQVANWLSFRKAWKRITASPYAWFLLVEDDIKFTHRAGESWNKLITADFLNECKGFPCIIRCGWQLGGQYIDDLPAELLEGIVRMANHCSILNRSMAEVLLAGSEDLIHETSDMYVHERMATQYRNFTMFPPISYDLSFALKVPSMIRPKGVEGDDLYRAAQIKASLRVSPETHRAWLRCLVWAPNLHVSESTLRPPYVHVTSWANLDPSNHRAFAPVDENLIRLEGDFVVSDPRTPPSWLYAASRVYIGNKDERPRGFLLYDVEEQSRVTRQSKANEFAIFSSVPNKLSFSACSHGRRTAWCCSTTPTRRNCWARRKTELP